MPLNRRKAQQFGNLWLALFQLKLLGPNRRPSCTSQGERTSKRSNQLSCKRTSFSGIRQLGLLSAIFPQACNARPLMHWSNVGATPCSLSAPLLGHFRAVHTSPAHSGSLGLVGSGVQELLPQGKSQFSHTPSHWPLLAPSSSVGQLFVGHVFV